MKFFLKLTLLVLFTSLIKSNDNSMQTETNCVNPCLVCQETIYNPKHSSVANCENTQCKNTCYQVDQLWKKDEFLDFIFSSVSYSSFYI